jgi:hypothetical protein
MDKQEAMARIAAIEDEAKRLRAIIDAPDADDRKIIGKACLYDCRPEFASLPNDGIFKLIVSRTTDGLFIDRDGKEFRYSRPATFAELGYPWVEDARKFITDVANGKIYKTSIFGAREARRIAAMMEE